MLELTREEFIDAYVEGSGVSREQVLAIFVPYPCDPAICDYPGCKGWQMVHRFDERVRDQLTDDELRQLLEGTGG